MLALVTLTVFTSVAAPQDTLGKRLYDRGCASCHGVDGRGVDPRRVAHTVPVPDFTDCSFSTREPDADWLAVVHEGGPVRGFDSTMPAFGEAFGEEEILRILEHVRTMCGNDAWPRGELNLPRAFLTEKAYPEDEAVTTVTANAEGAGLILNELVYEKRLGARSQIEIEVPFGARERAAGGWDVGVGDVAVAVKHALLHGLSSGMILSVGAEVVLPTGSESRGFGSGTVIFEPFVSFGKAFPADIFMHAQGKFEIGADDEKAEPELAWGTVLGKTWTTGKWGRTWTPMLELVGARELESGAGQEWDVVPQMQVSLNTRQHVLLNFGVRVPLTEARSRPTQLMLYVLWDWFDGGLLDGW
jgi:mono/diheme cytochrome c family protein